METTRPHHPLTLGTTVVVGVLASPAHSSVLSNSGVPGESM
jgi:hypothetical protein